MNRAGAFLLAIILAGAPSARASHFTTSVSQGIPADWLDPVWEPGGVAPTAGHTYETIANGVRLGPASSYTRIRNPSAASGDPAVGLIVFPGNWLLVNADTELRLKGPGNIVEFRGVGGEPGLRLNGGALAPGGGASPSDEGLITLTGRVSVVSTSVLGSVGSVQPLRALRLAASLAGSGSLILIQGTTHVPSVEVTSPSNSFSGSWMVKCGYLKGSGPDSLGSGDLILDGSVNVPEALLDPATPLNSGPVVLEIDYDIVSPGMLFLGLSAQMLLHQDCHFDRVVVGGFELAQGVYSYEWLRWFYPDYFPAGGSGSLTVGAPPGMVRVWINTVGSGKVTTMPARAYYTPGEPVSLSALPDRWWEFTGWDDGTTENPRSIVATNARYAATFSPVTALESLSIAGRFRTAPVGLPVVLVDGEWVVDNEPVMRTGSAQVELRTTFPDGMIFYTLDGEAPTFFSDLYTEPLVLRESATIRAFACTANFSPSWETDPVVVWVEPLYTLQTITAGGGFITVSPPGPAYTRSTVVTLTALPWAGWEFLGWLSSTGETSNPATLVMDQNHCVEAVFGTPLNLVTPGGGTILREPAAERYAYGTPVTLSAIPQAGQAFARWGNAATGTNSPLTFTVDRPEPTLSAAFAPIPAGQCTLTLVTHGRGQVTSDPPGTRFPLGTRVQLRATAEPGEHFLGWIDDATGIQTPITLSMDRDQRITARFTHTPRLSIVPGFNPARDAILPVALTGEWGSTVSVQSASSVAGPWNDAFAFTLPFGRAQFPMVPGASNIHCFYRAVAVTDPE